MKAEVIDFSQFDTEETIAPEAPKAKSTIDFSQFDPKPAPVAPKAKEPEADNAWTRFVMGNTDTAANVFGLAERERAILGEGKTNQRPIRPDEALVRTGSNVISGVGGAISDAVGPYIPQGVKDAAGQAIGAASDLAMKVPKVQRGVAAYRALQDVDPQSAETLGASANVASMAIPGPKGFGVPLSGVAKKMRSSGIDSLRRVSNRKAKALERVLADDIGKGKGDLVVKGPNATVSHEATDWEKARNMTVAQVPEVKLSNIAGKNHIATREAARAERKLLEAKITKAGNPSINKDTLMDDIGKMVEEIDNSPEWLTLKGNAPVKAYAEDLMQHAFDLISNSKDDAISILQARRDFDKWIETTTGTGVAFEMRSAKTLASRMIRNRMNQAVEEAVPSVPMKASLTKQSHLLDAKDRFLDIAQGEGADRWERIINKLSGKTHVGPVGAMSIASVLSGGAVAGLGAVMGLPVAAGVTGGGLIAAAWMIPKARRSQMLGKALTTVGRKMRGATGEPLRELSAQRLVLIELLKETQAEKETKEPKGE